MEISGLDEITRWRVPSSRGKVESIDMRGGSLTLSGKKFSVALSVRGAKGIFLPFLGWVRKQKPKNGRKMDGTNSELVKFPRHAKR
jgi:hypothetical protein